MYRPRSGWTEFICGVWGGPVDAVAPAARVCRVGGWMRLPLGGSQMGWANAVVVRGYHTAGDRGELGRWGSCARASREIGEIGRLADRLASGGCGCSNTRLLPVSVQDLGIT